MLNARRRQTELAIDLTHPLGLTLDEVVVHGHEVNALAGKRIQGDRQRGGEGLALTGPHLGDLALMHDRSAHDLDVKVAHAEGSLGCLASERKRLRQQIVQRLSGSGAHRQILRLANEIFVGESFVVGFEVVDIGRYGR